MAIQFTKVPTIGVDDPRTSKQHNRLAKAINERILSGIGDFTQRFAHWALNLVTQIRNQQPIVEGASLWPPADEWLQFYCHLPWNEGLVWPDAEPCDWEGVNCTTPLGAFVHGAAWAGLGNEVDRITGNMLSFPTIDSTETDLYFWEAGKQHRGAFDPDLGVSIAPARNVAVAHYRIGYPPRAYYGKSYGGFFGSPEPANACDDITTPANPKFLIRFTPKAQYAADYPVREFYCCCGPETADSIAGYYGTKLFWVLMEWGTDPLTGGDVTIVSEILLKEIYFEGPYDSGGFLRRDEGEQLEYVLHEYVKTLRGSDAQWKEGPHIEDVGFDWQKFFERPYLLAPAHGVWDEETETLTATYPTWEITDESVSTGLVGAPIAAHDGFIIAGWFVKVHKLTQPLTISLREETLGKRSEMVINPSPDDSKIVWLDEWPLAGNWQPYIETETALDSGGSILIQLAELQAIRPELGDAYLVARAAMSLGGATDDQDEIGDAFDYAKEASDAYFARGCVSGRGITGVDKINTSVMHEAARRLINRHMRLAGKNLIVGYRVNEDGDSELIFKRYAILQSHDLDVFRGIAPDVDAVISNIRAGIEYEAKEGDVLYNGVLYHDGDKFIGVLNQPDFIRPEGSTGNVYESNILSEIGLQDGESNRWVLHLTFNQYHTSDSSLWKLDLYDNSLRHPQRCHVYSDAIKDDRELNQHFSYRQDPVLYSDAVSGHTYAKGNIPHTTDDAVRLGYYCSCRIYPQPYEIKKAEAFKVGSEQRVRVVIKGRLHHREGDWFPTSEDTGTWDGDGIAAVHENSYRTDENGLVEYLWHVATNANFNLLVGDYALNLNEGHNLPFIPDNPFSAIIPRFWFTHLIPEVYEDDEDNVENEHDTICSADQFSDMSLYLRVMCEGWVDTKTSQDLACRDGSTLIDFTAQNLWLQASDNVMTGFPILPYEYRPDTERASGVGTLPNTIIHHDHYNILAKAVNLLNRARLEIPIKSRSRSIEYWDEIASEPPHNGGGEDSCGDTGGRWWDGLELPRAETLQTTNDWSDWEQGVFGLSYAITYSIYFLNLTTCTIRTSKSVEEIQIAIGNEFAECAVSSVVKDLIAEGSFAVFGSRKVLTQASGLHRELTTIEDSQLCDISDGSFRPFFDGEGYYKWTGGEQTEELSCTQVLSSDSVPEPVSVSDMWQGKFPPSGGNPSGFCGSTIVNRVEFDPIAQAVPMVEVPLVNPDAPILE